MSTTTTAAPFSVQVRVLHDPTNRLQGELPAQINAQGLVINAEPAVVVPTGSPVTYLGRNRLAVKVEDREVHLAVKKSLTNQNLMAYDLAAYLHGDIDQPEAKTYALPMYLFLPALLVLAIPLVMWLILDRAQATETQRAIEAAVTLEKMEELRRQNVGDMVDGLTQSDWSHAAQGATWLKDIDQAQAALDRLQTAGSLLKPEREQAVKELKLAGLPVAAKSLELAPHWVVDMRMWIFLGSIALALMLSGICLANAFHSGWRVGRRMASAVTVMILGYAVVLGALFLLEYDFRQKNENPEEAKERELAARLTPQTFSDAARFSVHVPGTPQQDKVTWKINTEDSLSLDRLTWSDPQIGMTYSVMYGKLPEKWTNYILDERRLEIEAVQDVPGGARIANQFVNRLALNVPRGGNRRSHYPLREFKLVLSNNENMFRRCLTVPREDGMWLYWTTATGKAAEQLKWPVQHFHGSFRITDLPSKPGATAMAAIPGSTQANRRTRSAAGGGGAGAGLVDRTPQGDAVRWPGVTRPGATAPSGDRPGGEGGRRGGRGGPG